MHQKAITEVLSTLLNNGTRGEDHDLVDNVGVCLVPWQRRSAFIDVAVVERLLPVVPGYLRLLDLHAVVL